LSKKKFNPAKFAREVKQEATRVSWPSRKETITSTAIVLGITAFASLFFVSVDSIIALLIQLILGIGR
jgi:preprotein translocase subunit SecE